MADKTKIIDPKKTEQVQQVKAETFKKEGGQDLNKINQEFQEKSVMRRAKDLGVKYVNIAKAPLNSDFLKILTVEEATKGRIIPFYNSGKDLRVAVEDFEKPETRTVLKDLESKGYKIDINLASSAGVDEALKNYSGNQQYKKPDIIEKVDKADVKTYEKEIADMADLAKKLETVTGEEGMNMINVGAMKTGASDVHFEPEENSVFVRFRIDGVLHKVFEMNPGVYKNLLNQIKYKSRMRLNVWNVPQDGRYDFMFNENKIDVRTASIPTPYGEALVCRFLVSGEGTMDFEDLGFHDTVLKKLDNAVKLSQGMVLVTGPTGSGKTTTLYSILSKMNKPESKIITLEDPVEYHVNGVIQSQIDEKRGYNFASGLRAILRQDPNIVMIGEIRDLDTAETAAQAALTGHVLLSTLHTNSAIETIPRLINMGLEPFMVAPALDTVIAQRLVRKACPDCSTKEPITDSQRAEFEKVFSNLKNVNSAIDVSVPDNLVKVHGCDKCSHTGYQGRVVIAEALKVDEEMKNLILENSSTIKMIQSARIDGMITIREDGYMKAAQGITTLEEVHRVTDVSI